MKILPDGSVQFINGQIESLESQRRLKAICKQCEELFKEPKKRPRIVKDYRKYGMISAREKTKATDVVSELCPNCEQVVSLKNQFIVQTCPSCKKPILPCSICEFKTKERYDNCANCPLESNK